MYHVIWTSVARANYQGHIVLGSLESAQAVAAELREAGAINVRVERQ